MLVAKLDHLLEHQCALLFFVCLIENGSRESVKYLALLSATTTFSTFNTESSHYRRGTSSQRMHALARKRRMACNMEEGAEYETSDSNANEMQHVGKFGFGFRNAIRDILSSARKA
ncbi:unnamed protein product [Toxocara canis]|uniref:Secreted protein n=1 Tax=Toxocara canis TaxID=6265 RepID=A0A183UVV0_TOXCA|nr:unnamed protein product [Toxocara canis]